MDTNLSELRKRITTGKPSIYAVHGIRKSWTWLSHEQEEQNFLGRQVSVCPSWYIFSFKKMNDSPCSSAAYESVQSGLNWPCRVALLRLSVCVISLFWPFLVHVWMWELDHKESWVPKNWYFWTVVLEKTLESPLDCNPIGKQSWIFIGRTDAEAEALILWLPDGKNWLIGKDPNAGKDWRQEEKGMTKDEMIGWHHQLDWHEFEHAPGVGDGQGSLACCSPWGHKELDMIDRLNWTAY